MPVSHFEYIFYSLCIRAQVPTFSLRQDFKQVIAKTKIKNIDFICYHQKKIYLIDVKGMSTLTGDTKVAREDIQAMEVLKETYGKNAEALFVYLWVKKKIDIEPEKDLLLQKFRVKAIDLDAFKSNMVLQKGWGDKFYRCDKCLIKNIWEYIPNFADLIEQPARLL